MSIDLLQRDDALLLLQPLLPPVLLNLLHLEPHLFLHFFEPFLLMPEDAPRPVEADLFLVKLGAVLCFVIVLFFGLHLCNPVALFELLLAVGVVAVPTELAAPSFVHILAHGPLESLAFVAF